MTKPSNAARLPGLIRRLDAELARIEKEIGPQPAFRGTSWDEVDRWRHQEAIAFNRLLNTLKWEEGASVSMDGAGHRMRMAGVATSCTNGVPGLLRNWQNAARRRIEKETGGMTPKMVAALQAAARADADGGLVWTAAGWKVPGTEDYHGPVVVSRLVWWHGYLAEAGKPGRSPGESRRVITPKGWAQLADIAGDGRPGDVPPAPSAARPKADSARTDR